MKEVSREQLVERLRVENLWWREPYRISSLFREMTPRPYMELFYPLVTDRELRRAVVLMGPRRVGKTVMIHHTIQKLLDEGNRPERLCYVSVDHPLYHDTSLEDFLSLYREAAGVDADEPCTVFFDEIQYLKDWERHLKSLVDSYPNLKLVASGSAAAALKLKSVESGAGRFTDFVLPPLMFQEYVHLVATGSSFDRSQLGEEQIATLNELFINYLNFGGYPELALSEKMQQDPGRFIKADIIDKVLLRDLPSLYGIADIQELNHLFSMLAYNTGNEVSLDGLSKSSGVAKNTIKKYISYLEAAFLLRVVHRVDENARRFKRANFFKVYLTNPSMRSALFSPVTADSEDIGALVETAVFAQWFHYSSPLHYARWRQGEVDLVVTDGKQKPAYALEVKWSNRYINNVNELAQVVKFCKTNRLAGCWVTTVDRYGDVDADGVTLSFLPASAYCYATGEGRVAAGKLERTVLPSDLRGSS